MSSLTAYVSINFLSQQNHKSQMEQDKMPESAGRLPLVCSATMRTKEHLHPVFGVPVTPTLTYSFLKLPKPFWFFLLM